MDKFVWKKDKHLLRYVPETAPKTKFKKMMLFDLDSTLIKTESGKRHAKKWDDWVWFNAIVPAQLKSLVDSGIGVVIVSNQSGLGKNPERMEMFKKKVENIFQVLGFPIPLFAATDLVYRKPSPSIFEQYIHPFLQLGPKIQMVGDAAGRQGDFADSDRAFAYNICMVVKHKDPSAHISFRTPEEYFLKEKLKKMTWFSSFDPQKYLDSFSGFSTENPENDESILSKTLEKYPHGVYFLVGPPASGKSTLTESVLQDAVVVSKDKQGSKALATLQKALNNKNPETLKKIVIDDTNPTVEAREKYLKEIPKSIPRVCILTLGYKSQTTKFNLESKLDRAEQIEIAKHFMKMRIRSALLAGEEPREIPDIVYNMYNAKFQLPTKAEGFDKIIQIPLIPHFSNDDELLNFLLKF